MRREGNLGADPLPVFKEEREDLGCVNYADRGSHERALPRGLTELEKVEASCSRVPQKQDNIPST